MNLFTITETSAQTLKTNIRVTKGETWVRGGIIRAWDYIYTIYKTDKLIELCVVSTETLLNVM